VIALFKKEVNGFFSSLSGYVVVALFLAATGLLLWIIPGSEFNIPESNYATLDGLFILSPWLFLFLIPAVTMRMFAEENKTGTIELLMTRPISDFRIVLAKFMAAVTLAVLSLLPTLTYFFSVYLFASPKGNVDVAGITGSYLGLLFLCSAFASIGNFCSAATNNQIVSFLLALVMSYFFYSGFDLMSGFGFSNIISNIIAQFGISAHYASMSRGVIDTRDVVYFICITLFFLLCTRFTLEKRKW
jgi:ABC-2 type transport system permease protein